MLESSNHCPAVARGVEMLRLPMTSLPREAVIYAGYLCLRVGMCTETLLSAYTTYAQIVEGLSCDDDLYTVTPTIRAEWDVALRDYELVPLAVDQGPPRLHVRRTFRPAGSSSLVARPERVVIPRPIIGPGYLASLGKKSCWCKLGPKCQGEHEIGPISCVSVVDPGVLADVLDRAVTARRITEDQRVSFITDNQRRIRVLRDEEPARPGDEAPPEQVYQLLVRAR